MKRVSISVILSLLVTACGGTISSSSTSISAETVIAGQDLFVANCAQCHGVDLRGTETGPSFLSSVYVPGHHADYGFVLAVQNGVQAHHWQFGNMPAVEGLTVEDIAFITAYVRSVQNDEGFEE